MAAEPKPFSNKDTDPEALREKTVSTPDSTFDERTNATYPWMREDGSQRNGAEDIPQEGADAPEDGEEARAEKATARTRTSSTSTKKS